MFIAIGIGDEGGFAPPISQPHEALDLLMDAIKRAGHEGKVKLGIDPASSEFFKDDKYDLGFKGKESHPMQKSAMADLYRKLIEKYPIVLLEDPFAEDDWESWTAFNKDCKIELVGDDLLATNVRRIEIADRKKACNSLLLKINQIGTITEALAA
jgi:enolase